MKVMVRILLPPIILKKKKKKVFKIYDNINILNLILIFKAYLS